MPSFLVSDLLLLNQFPDVEADRSVGRRHFPIAKGRKASSTIYGAFLALAYLSIILGIILALLPVLCGIALFTVIPAWRAYRGAVQHAGNARGLIPSMGMNVIVNLTTPSLLAVGLFFG